MHGRLTSWTCLQMILFSFASKKYFHEKKFSSSKIFFPRIWWFLPIVAETTFFLLWQNIFAGSMNFETGDFFVRVRELVLEKKNFSRKKFSPESTAWFCDPAFSVHFQCNIPWNWALRTEISRSWVQILVYLHRISASNHFYGLTGSLSKKIRKIKNLVFAFLTSSTWAVTQYATYVKSGLYDTIQGSHMNKRCGHFLSNCTKQ